MINIKKIKKMMKKFCIISNAKKFLEFIKIIVNLCMEIKKILTFVKYLYDFFHLIIHYFN